MLFNLQEFLMKKINTIWERLSWFFLMFRNVCLVGILIGLGLMVGIFADIGGNMIAKGITTGDGVLILIASFLLSAIGVFFALRYSLSE